MTKEIEIYDFFKPSEIEQHKRKLIDDIKQTFGQDCIKEETRNFKRKHIIVFQNEGNEIILDYHFGHDKDKLFGADVNFIDYVANFIENNNSRKIYYYVLLILILSEKEELYFAIPIFYIKNNESNIYKTKGDKYVPQYRFNIVYENGKYWLRLKNNPNEDISIFQTNIKGLLNQSLINRYEEEKEKYFSNKKDREELLKKYKSNQFMP